MGKKVDWAKIRNEYIFGSASCADLARAYNLSVSAVKKKCSAEGWVEQKNHAETEAALKIKEATIGAQTKVAKGVFEIAEKLLGKLDLALDCEGDRVEPKRLQIYSAILKDLKDVRGDKNARDLREQNARIRKLSAEAKKIKQDADRLRQETGKTDDEKITVLIEDDYGT